MPLLSIDCEADGQLGPLDMLDAVLDGGIGDRAVIVMVHGFKYDFTLPAHSPHRILFSPTIAPARRAAPWSTALGADTVDGPLCIGFGWRARGSIWKAWDRSEDAAAGLARLLEHIGSRLGRPAHAIAHSLGARVVLRAMPRMLPGSLGRAVLLAGAALRSEAQTAMSSPAGRMSEVVSVTTRENDLFDAGLELAIRRGPSIGAGLGADARHWLDLQIDNDAVRTALAGMGYTIAAPEGRICHWSVYSRDGVFPLYRDLLDDPRRLPLSVVRAQLPCGTTPRWSRLMPSARFRPLGSGMRLRH